MSTLWIASLDYGTYSGWQSAGCATQEQAIHALEAAKTLMSAVWHNIRNERIDATCTTCGAVYKRRCSSGLMRQHIANFARVHLHRDPLNP